jgi:hypothetical protein
MPRLDSRKHSLHNKGGETAPRLARGCSSLSKCALIASWSRGRKRLHL